METLSKTENTERFIFLNMPFDDSSVAEIFFFLRSSSGCYLGELSLGGRIILGWI
jgi:hypothetical protein